MQAWRVEVLVRPEHPDPAGDSAQKALQRSGLGGIARVRSRRGYLLGADLTAEQVRTFAQSVLADPVTDAFEVHAPGARPPGRHPGEHRVSVLLRPGVTDPVAHSVQKALVDAGLPEVPAATYKAFLVQGDVAPEQLQRAAKKALANDVIQEVLPAVLPEGLPGPGGNADLAVHLVPLDGLDEAGLVAISQKGGLALDGAEMAAIQRHFQGLGRPPTQMELETLA